MKPPVTDHSQGDLFRPRISAIINPKNPIKQLGDTIDWAFFEKEFGEHYKEGPTAVEKKKVVNSIQGQD